MLAPFVAGLSAYHVAKSVISGKFLSNNTVAIATTVAVGGIAAAYFAPVIAVPFTVGVVSAAITNYIDRYYFDGAVQNYVFKRVPRALLETGVNYMFPGAIAALGNNPNNRNIVEDIINSRRMKVICKGGVIGAGFFLGMPIHLAARAANYICEPQQDYETYTKVAIKDLVGDIYGSFITEHAINVACGAFVFNHVDVVACRVLSKLAYYTAANYIMSYSIQVVKERVFQEETEASYNKAESLAKIEKYTVESLNNLVCKELESLVKECNTVIEHNDLEDHTVCDKAIEIFGEIHHNNCDALEA